MSNTRLPPGNFEQSLKDFPRGKGNDHFRDAVIDVMDTAEFACRWLVDHGIEPQAGALAQFTALIFERAKALKDANHG